MYNKEILSKLEPIVPQSLAVSIQASIYSNVVLRLYDDYYVRYQDQEGKTIEATISNPKRKGLVPGARIRIRYLPEKPKSVVYIALKNDE